MAISSSSFKTFSARDCKISAYWTVTTSATGLIYTFQFYCDTGTAKKLVWYDDEKATIIVGFGKKTYSFKSDTLPSEGNKLIGNLVTDEATFEEIVEHGYINFELPKARQYISLTGYTYIEKGLRYFGVKLSDCLNRPANITSVTDCILGENSTLNVAKGDNEFTHTITYSCGTDAGTVCEKSSDTAITAKLPLPLAAHSPDSTRIEVEFTITTYYGNVPILSNSGKAYYSIPETVKPSCTIKITEGAYINEKPIADVYGGYVQRKSMLRIEVTPIPAYGSPIVSYSISANGSEFDTPNVITGVLKNSGTQDVRASVTDARGRTSEIVLATIEAIPYSMPAVTYLKVNRCDKDGVEQAEAKYNDHIKVTFDARISPINDKNSAEYTLRYQKTTGFNQEDRALTDYSGVYSVNGGTCIFEAALRDSYDITIIAADDFGENSRTTGGSTATTIYNVHPSGLGICFGGLATLENVIENRFLTYPNGGFMFPTIEKTSDEEEINIWSYETPNVYIVKSGADVYGSPVDSSYTLIVLPTDDDNDVIYIAITKDLDIYINRLVDSSWGVWKTFTLTDVE